MACMLIKAMMSYFAPHSQISIQYGNSSRSGRCTGVSSHSYHFSPCNAVEIRADSFARSGPMRASARTYSAANGCNTGKSPPAAPRYARISESSPRAMNVSPRVYEAPEARPAARPANLPASRVPARVSPTAPRAGPTAPWRAKGSMVRPKVKAEKSSQEIAAWPYETSNPLSMFRRSKHATDEEHANNLSQMQRL